MFASVVCAVARVEADCGKAQREVAELAKKFFAAIASNIFLPGSPTLR